jgi:hypothetical protein
MKHQRLLQVHFSVPAEPSVQALPALQSGEVPEPAVPSTQLHPRLSPSVQRQPKQDPARLLPRGKVASGLQYKPRQDLGRTRE